MSLLKFILGTINALCVMIIILFTAITIPTYSVEFYQYEYKKNQTAQAIHISENELMGVTKYMIQYLQDKKADLDVAANVGGIERGFFNQKEKDHMVDVKLLFSFGYVVRNMAVILFIFTFVLLLLLKIKPLPLIAKANRIMLSATLILAGILAFIISLDFESSFNTFHEMFFTNDLWQLNPDIDLLINIVPLEFFVDIAIVVSSIFVLFSLIIIISSSLYLHFREED